MPKARGKPATARVPFPVRASERPSRPTRASTNGRAKRSRSTPKANQPPAREPTTPRPSQPGAPRDTSKPRPTNNTHKSSKSKSLGKPRGPSVQPLDMDETLKARELFWANVIREILCSLADESRRVAEAARHQPPSQLPPAASSPPASPDQQAMQQRQQPESILDGRIAVITNYGERIPIVEVKPLFAMGVDRSPETRALSMAVECSVFQIRSPKGMVYTLPIHEIRGIRAMSEELMDELEAHANREDQSTTHPFGFAAFTSLARAGLHRVIDLPPVTDEGYGE